jgi:hypothetical protein
LAARTARSVPPAANEDGDAAQSTHWADAEIDESAVKDARLGRRYSELIRHVGDRMDESIPYACQDWASTKAAYRFLANDRVEEGESLSGQFGATRDRFARSDGPILLIQDTTEFVYKRERLRDIGFTNAIHSGRDKQGRIRHHKLYGMLMHSSLAVTTDGLPLGLAAVKFWTRKAFKGTAQVKKRINGTRVPIEKKRKACAGSTICANRSICSARRTAASMSAIVRATSMNCFA